MCGEELPEQIDGGHQLQVVVATEVVDAGEDVMEGEGTGSLRHG